MADLPKIIAVAHEVKTRFDELLLRASVRDSGEARVAATLCLTIAEQFAAALHLVEGGFSTHAPVVVRSMLEGLATLLNLVKDPNYLDLMRFESARADVVLFEECAGDPDIREDTEAVATLEAWKDKAQPVRDALRAKGIKHQGIIEQFKRAGMLQNYVAYRVFCSFAHNQLTTLLSRHAGNFELRYRHEAPVETTASMLTAALSILCQAIHTLPNFTDLPACEVTGRGRRRRHGLAPWRAPANRRRPCHPILTIWRPRGRNVRAEIRGYPCTNPFAAGRPPGRLTQIGPQVLQSLPESPYWYGSARQ